MVPMGNVCFNRRIIWNTRLKGIQKVMSGKKSRTGLSNVQNVRLGGLIAVLSGREPYEYILSGLLADGFVKRTEGGLNLTEKGMREKDRLATLAGLMVEKDYARPLPPLTQQA
jgi:hypothetical protein